MNLEEEKKPFRLLIVGSGEDLSPRMKANVAILLGKHPDMEIEYKNVSSPDDWAEEEAECWIICDEYSQMDESVFNNMKLRCPSYYPTRDGFKQKLNTKPYYRQKERY